MRVDVTTELNLQDNEEGRQQTRTAEQSGEGVVYFDERNGRVVDATLKHQIAEESNYAPGSFNATITAKLLVNTKQ